MVVVIDMVVVVGALVVAVVWCHWRRVAEGDGYDDEHRAWSEQFRVIMATGFK